MTNPTIRIHNVETNEVVDREMTDEEFAIYQEELTAHAELEAASEQKALQKIDEKAALLERLGLTEEELQTILG
jgi:hypothetical protein